MATIVFSVSGPSNMRFGYWNIHGVRNKLENKLVMSWIIKHDVIFLGEVKTSIQFTVPGYTVIRKTNASNMHRGGVVLLVKNYVYKLIRNVTCDEDQIWIQLAHMHNIQIGGCYIPPQDSQYYTDVHFAKIQEKCMDGDYSTLMLGDFNSRCGGNVYRLQSNMPEDMFYDANLPDQGKPNSNGEKLLQLCRDTDCVILNNLHNGQVYYKGCKTFRRKENWVSELDLCVLSSSIVDSIMDTYFDQNLNLPSDHAPISVLVNTTYFDSPVMLSERLLHGASELGSHATLHRDSTTQQLCKHGVKFRDVDPNKFSEMMTTANLPEIEDPCQIGEVISEITNVLYDCTQASKNRQIDKSCNNKQSDRWKRILDIGDDKMLWRAINWKGQYMANDLSDETPSDIEFKQHFEKLLNPDSLQELDLTDMESNVNIPVLDKPVDPAEVDYVIKHQVKSNKGCGPDGLCPGIFKLLPVQWIMFLTVLFTNILYNCYCYLDYYLSINYYYYHHHLNKL